MLSERWPSVCVVIPNHDRVNELLQAVASVEAQHYEGQVRIYIVYRERPGIDGVLSRLENVIALPSTNEEGRNSLAVKRNIAIDASTEDLVAFLDDDDVWHPLKLAAQVMTINSGDGTVAVSTRPTYFSEQPRWNRLAGGKGYRDCTRRRLVAGGHVGTSSLLIDGPTARRLRFDERPEWFGVSDFDFKIRLSHLGPIRGLKGKYTAYRADNASISAPASVEGKRLFALRVVSVLAASVERSSSGLAERLSALRQLIVLTFGGYGPVRGFHGGKDVETEEFLDRILDGRLFRRLDHSVSLVVKTGWRRGWTARPVRLVMHALRVTGKRLVRLARSARHGSTVRSQWLPPCGPPRP